MKEISKYLQKFMSSNFRQEVFHLSPEVASFWKERYREIEDADTQWNKHATSILANATPIDFSRTNEWKKGEQYHYLESYVKEYLENANKMGIICEFSVFDQQCTLFIVYPLPPQSSIKTISKKKQTDYYESVLRKVYLWLWIANKYRTKECSRQLTIYLYLCDLPKLLNNETILGRSHVNTGFTMACSSKNEIYVFREEEWFKVFIHEVFHAFGIDFADSRLTHTQELCQSRIQRIFKVPHINILVFETFTEVCAEVLNLLFFMYFTKNEGRNKTNDRARTRLKTTLRRMKSASSQEQGFSPKILALLLKTEIEFSAFQCAKVLDHASMEYTDLYSQSPESIQKRRKYRENSNVLSYYVLKSILLNHFDAFMQWLIHSNDGSFKFLTNSRNTDAFCNLIENNYNKPEYVAKMNMYSNWIRRHRRENTIETKTLRMTVYE